MKISIVVPVYNEKESLAELVRQIDTVLSKKELSSYELLLINDGSTDSTLDEIKRLAKADKRVRYLSFSRNFGHQAALRAGLARATGDAVITMDADLQHPPRMLPELIQRWQEGNDIVYTRRRSGRETSWYKRLTSKLFYSFLNRLSGLAMDEGAADFRLIDARVVAVINQLPEQNLFLRGFISWSGFRVCAIDYRPDPRFAGQSGYSFRKMLTLALHGITQFSMKPLRLASILGLMFAVVGALYGLYATWLHFSTNVTISGWTSVLVSVLVMGGIQLIILGIIGEYLGRTFMQTKQRPDYIIKEEG
jgi:glycosyltransferase involved in cell wall biosynthesis